MAREFDRAEHWRASMRELKELIRLSDGTAALRRAAIEAGKSCKALALSVRRTRRPSKGARRHVRRVKARGILGAA